LDLADSVELDWLVSIMNARFCRCGFPVLTSVIVIAALVLCETGCKSPAAPGAVVVKEQSPHEPSAAASPNPPAAPGLGSFTAYGPLVAEQQADVASQRDGRVTRVAAGIGDRVHAGQLLAQLDDSVLRAQYEAQKARIAAAQAEVRNSKAEQESARADLRRADALLKDKILSQENWEVSKYKVDETTAQVERYESEQAVAGADLNAMQVALDQSRIVAPFDGVVGRVSVRAEQQVKEGDILFWITAEAPLRVLFTVPESAVRWVSVGTALELTTPDYPGLRQQGHVLRLSPVIDPASASIQVIGALDHPSPLLKPGMSMQVRLVP
jgi:RND family efflux transporter MFP subunit